MKMTGILVPIDFSEASDAALRYAADMAQTFGARLYLLHVPGKTGENFEASFPVGRVETAAQERLTALLSQEELERLRPAYASRIGKPAEEIVRYADACEVDLIIMGTHGRSGVAHLVMGSVAEQVVRSAECPVLLVRRPKGAFRESHAPVRAVDTAGVRTVPGVSPQS
jgi:universal stress protein A